MSNNVWWVALQYMIICQASTVPILARRWLCLLPFLPRALYSVYNQVLKVHRSMDPESP
jgi:hypothetical protein